VFGDFGLLSALVRLCLFTVGTCSSRSVMCRDAFVEVGFVSRRVRRIRLSVRTCPARSVNSGT